MRLIDGTRNNSYIKILCLLTINYNSKIMTPLLQKASLTTTFLCVLLFFTYSVKAQNQNALSFDGVDDVVNTPAASSLIVGSSEISITCWVYPTNATPVYPNFDGFAGMRNDVDADFYLVQTGASQLEARFRNSTGAAFDINYMGLQINTWQHFALTYDGTKMRLYKNGALADSVSANGTISNTAVDFNSGTVVFLNAPFLLTGKLDEVSLWTKAIQLEELHCIYLSTIDTASTGLQLYYQYNQGINGGNNTSITNAIDAKNHIDGVLNSFTLTGSASNFVAGSPGSSAPISASICKGGSYNFGTQILTSAGVYTDVFTSASGCDSTVQLTLSIDSVDISLLQTNTTIYANQIGATYQWLNCNTGFSLITGATARFYTPVINGSYAVIITLNSCSDTSVCLNYNSVGLADFILLHQLNLYPNPATNTCTIFAPAFTNAILSLSDVLGRVVLQTEFNTFSEVSIGSLSNGMYVLRIDETLNGKNNKGVKTKLIKR